MMVLTTQPGQEIRIGDVTITLLADIKVRVGVDAPNDKWVRLGEVVQVKKRKRKRRK